MTEHRETKAAQIARALADRIISGTLEPGARLRQDHVAEEFGASHVPVREAFRLLEAQGLAKNEPRRGVRVLCEIGCEKHGSGTRNSENLSF